MPRRILALFLATLFLAAPIVQATPSNIWTHRYGGTDDKGFNEVVVDPFGNIVGIGYFYNTITVNSLFTTNGNDDIFVAKFDPNGNPLWSKHLGGVSGDNAMDIATDYVGNVIAVGSVSTSASTDAALVVKYAPDGTQRFLKQYGSGKYPPLSMDRCSRSAADLDALPLLTPVCPGVAIERRMR